MEILRKSARSLLVWALHSRNNLIIGSSSQHDKVLYHESVQKPMKWRAYIDHVFAYDAKPGETITAVEVLDKRPLFGGRPNIQAGGHGFPFVAVRVKSRYCCGVHFTFTVYGTQEDNQLDAAAASAAATDSQNQHPPSSFVDEKCNHCGHDPKKLDTTSVRTPR